MMTFKEYEAAAMRTNVEHKSKNDALVNAALGLCGEAGEFADALKKRIFHGAPIDEEFLIKELGDALWYITQAATALDISLEDIAILNINKLKIRYPKGFTTEDSIRRVDVK